jgi:hypothetical protein
VSHGRVWPLTLKRRVHRNCILRQIHVAPRATHPVHTRREGGGLSYIHAVEEAFGWRAAAISRRRQGRRRREKKENGKAELKMKFCIGKRLAAFAWGGSGGVGNKEVLGCSIFIQYSIYIHISLPHVRCEWSGAQHPLFRPLHSHLRSLARIYVSFLLFLIAREYI